VNKWTFVLAAMLLASSGSASIAKHRKPVYRPYYAVPVWPYVSPEAARMIQAQRTWPGRALCDDGGYRIRPCDMYGVPR